VRDVGKPKISDEAGLQALHQWNTGDADNDSIALAVRFTLQVLAQRAPGASVEVRVPPYGAVQVREGTTHTRGTPPAVVEMSPEVWLRLATGQLRFSEALASAEVQASGVRSDLSDILPVLQLP
jgi:hypothetical protein